MAFTLPKFNLDCGIWHNYLSVDPLPAFPPGTAADEVSECQLYEWSRSTVPMAYYVAEPTDIKPWWFTLQQSIQVRLPPLTDVRDNQCAESADVIECPIGTGRWYIVTQVDDLHKGFPNEYRLAQCVKAWTWPTPIP